jgi:cytochrome c biogenesis protein CcmG/thiol:disulfide interchange protein DsbE
MKRILPFIPLMVIVALGILFAGYGLHHDPQVQPNALIGKPLPTQALPPLGGGQPQSIASTLKGPGIVNVFGSWCGPCAIEGPQLMKLKNAGIEMVGVSWMDRPGDTQAFLQRTGNPFGLVLVGTDDTAIEFGITGAPETFIVDGHGKVVDKRVGPITEGDVPRLVAQIKALKGQG